MTGGTTAIDSLGEVWGSSGSDVFAVGGGGFILHYNGTSWTAMDRITSNDLSGVWGSSGSDVFAVGFGGGTILHYTSPPTPCPECAGDPVNLQNVTFESGTNCECTSTTYITLGTNVKIKKGANITFKAPRINVEPGFHAENGAVVKMRQ